MYDKDRFIKDIKDGKIEYYRYNDKLSFTVTVDSPNIEYETFLKFCQKDYNERKNNRSDKITKEDIEEALMRR